MNCIAFDLGASSGKLSLGRFNGTTICLEPITKFDNAPVALNKGLYWDFQKIYQHLVLGIEQAQHAAGEKIETFGIDSFCNDFSFIDRQGELLYPVRCYRDTRTTRYQSRAFEKMSPAELFEASGNQISPVNTLMQIVAMQETGQGYLLEQAYKLLFLPDLLAHYLTGEIVSEYTVSSVSQMFDFRVNDWSDMILRRFGIPRRLFGELKLPGTVCGTIRKECIGGIAGIEHVTVCEHDTASAFLGSVCRPDAAIISSGTWALVGIQTEIPCYASFALKHQIANEGGYPGRHRLMRNVMGSWLIQQLKVDFATRGNNYTYGELSQMAKDESKFGWWIPVDDDNFLPPGDMAQRIIEMCAHQYASAPNTPQQLVRCVYESLVMRYRWSLEKLEQLTGRRIPMLNIVGGGAQDDVLCQMTADATGKVVVAGPVDASALGNIIVQLLAKKEISNLDQGRQLIAASYDVREYAPQDHEEWNEAYGRYCQQYDLS